MTNNKTIWITGASSGIGAATAKHAAEQGYDVVISARREERLQDLKRSIHADVNVHVVPLDVTAIDEHESIVDEVWEQAGPIDVFVHNAGITQRGLVNETELSVDRRVMEVNFFGVVSLTKAILPKMLDRGSGHFTIVSSVVGYIGTPMRSAYAASKHALHGYFDSLRAEVHDDGVGVTIVCPGYVDTEITVHALQADGSSSGERAEKQQEGASPERVARKLLSATESNKNEIYVGGSEIAAIYLQRLSPSLTARLVRKIETT
jgi:short-subunit dehydrogenase